MRNMLTKKLTLFFLGISTILVSAEPSRAVFIELTEKGLGLKKGNYGTCLAVNEFVEISAITNIGYRGGEETGTVYLNKGKKGLGVQNLDGRGGEGISGRGGESDEALVFDFIRNVEASSLKVGLSDYDKKKDEPVISLMLSDGAELVFNKKDKNWKEAVTFVRKKEAVLDLGVLLGQDFNSHVTGLSVTETKDGIYVNSITYHTPEPATVALLSLGGLILCIRRR